MDTKKQELKCKLTLAHFRRDNHAQRLRQEETKRRLSEFGSEMQSELGTGLFHKPGTQRKNRALDQAMAYQRDLASDRSWVKVYFFIFNFVI